MKHRFNINKIAKISIQKKMLINFLGNILSLTKRK